MSKIHYFQRYDSKENWATNSTLLLLSRLYHYDSIKFKRVLSVLTEAEDVLPIGVMFEQQRWSKASVVDGIIFQESFKIVIETKLADNFTSEQLIRHLEALRDTSGLKILLALSKNKISDIVHKEVVSVLKEGNYPGIQLASTTYRIIIEAIQDVLLDHDVEMHEILNDYIKLCNESNLTDIKGQTMLAVTANHSLTENLKFNIYYDPAVRNHSLPFEYLALYVNREIVAIGQVIKIITCDLINNDLVSPEGTPLQLSVDEYNRIKSIIEQTNYYNLKQGSKFFLVDNFYRTSYKKTSLSSLRAKRYFFLKKEIEGFTEEMSAGQVAALLNNNTWN